MSKLLYKPFKAFTVYALIILLCSIPVYYLVVDSIWLNELDEHNQIIKERIDNGFKNIQIEEDELNTLLENWNKLQPATTLTPSDLTEKKADSAYIVSRLNPYVKHREMDRFRGLSSYININGKMYHLTIETNVEETYETIWAITLITLVLYISLVVGFIVLDKQISKKIWQPFYKTLGKIKSFDLTAKQTVSFDKTDIEEFEELNQSVQKLINKNISAYNQQKTFIENASHELQTPLAVLKSKLDLLLQNKEITKEQSEIINAIGLPLSRVSRINKNLLLLAKIENNQFSEEDDVELTTIINETIELLFDYLTAKQITVNKNFASTIALSCNKILLEILITNLLINAIVHNTAKGSIQIGIAGRALTVSNTGKTALDENKLFERFAVSSSETANSGLGLAIVKKICDRYNWQINYTFENNHHCFSLQF